MNSCIVKSDYVCGFSVSECGNRYRRIHILANDDILLLIYNKQYFQLIKNNKISSRFEINGSNKKNSWSFEKMKNYFIFL